MVRLVYSKYILFQMSHLHDLIKPCVDYILSLQFPSGNFPSSLESKDRDRLIHWCHGAPGCVHMLATAYRVSYIYSYHLLLLNLLFSVAIW